MPRLGQRRTADFDGAGAVLSWDGLVDGAAITVDNEPERQAVRPYTTLGEAHARGTLTATAPSARLTSSPCSPTGGRVRSDNQFASMPGTSPERLVSWKRQPERYPWITSLRSLRMLA